MQNHGLYLGRVRYIDYASGNPHILPAVPGLEHIFSKRRSLAHESEVRAVVFPPEPDSGLSVTVNLAGMLERIVVSPGYPSWAIAALQAIIKNAGILIDVETSDLLNGPTAIG